jgi:hypothetical protein
MLRLIACSSFWIMNCLHVKYRNKSRGIKRKHSALPSVFLACFSAVKMEAVFVRNVCELPNYTISDNSLAWEPQTTHMLPSSFVYHMAVTRKIMIASVQVSNLIFHLDLNISLRNEPDRAFYMTKFLHQQTIVGLIFSNFPPTNVLLASLPIFVLRHVCRKPRYRNQKRWPTLDAL